MHKFGTFGRNQSAIDRFRDRFHLRVMGTCGLLWASIWSYIGSYQACGALLGVVVQNTSDWLIWYMCISRNGLVMIFCSSGRGLICMEMHNLYFRSRKVNMCRLWPNDGGELGLIVSLVVLWPCGGFLCVFRVCGDVVWDAPRHPEQVRGRMPLIKVGVS